MEKDNTLVQIGLRIKELRCAKEMSQQDLAAACNFEKSNMSRIESGKTNVTIGTLMKICEVLEIRLIDLIIKV